MSDQPSPMTTPSPRERAAEGLQVGDRFTIVRCFSDDDIRQFAQISRDYNPVHCEARYANPDLGIR